MFRPEIKPHVECGNCARKSHCNRKAVLLIFEVRLLIIPSALQTMYTELDVTFLQSRIWLYIGEVCYLFVSV